MTLTVLDTTSAFVNCSSVRRKWTHARKQSVLFFICFDAINATVKLYIKQLKVGQEVYAVRTIMQLYERRFRKIALHPRKACFILTKSFWQKKHTHKVNKIMNEIALEILSVSFSVSFSFVWIIIIARQKLSLLFMKSYYSS